jgi:hypothetical protein
VFVTGSPSSIGEAVPAASHGDDAAWRSGSVAELATQISDVDADALRGDG